LVSGLHTPFKGRIVSGDANRRPEGPHVLLVDRRRDLARSCNSRAAAIVNSAALGFALGQRVVEFEFASSDAAVAHCRMHQLIARKPATAA